MFVDREPYIRYWRPFYERYGPLIRRIRGIVPGAGAPHPDVVPDRASKGRTPNIDQRLAALEASNQQINAALEQVLLALMARRAETALDELRSVLVANFAAQSAQTSDQWGAIERLIIAIVGASTRESLAADEMYQPVDSASSVGQRNG
jgi:hypothetical protein